MRTNLIDAIPGAWEIISEPEVLVKVTSNTVSCHDTRTLSDIDTRRTNEGIPMERIQVSMVV